MVRPTGSGPVLPHIVRGIELSSQDSGSCSRSMMRARRAPLGESRNSAASVISPTRPSASAAVAAFCEKDSEALITANAAERTIQASFMICSCAMLPLQRGDCCPARPFHSGANSRKIQLPPSFKNDHCCRIGQVEASVAGYHRNSQTLLYRAGSQDIRGQAASFGAEYKRVAGGEAGSIIAGNPSR